jgi:hypothetical protein
MSATTPRSVISGKPYVVRQVRGRAPEELEDFAGDTVFVLDLDGEDYTVHGPGVEVETGMRVYEKSDHGVGKDIRCWLVRSAPDGDAFTATHVGIDVPPQAMQGDLA